MGKNLKQWGDADRTDALEINEAIADFLGLVVDIGDRGVFYCTDPREDGDDWHQLPDYSGSADLWGDLMARELDGWHRIERQAHRCFWVDDDGSRLFGPPARDIGTAVCLAILVKHGVDPTPYIGD